MLRSETCLVIVCDECKTDVLDEDDSVIHHFSTLEEVANACSSEWDLAKAVGDKHYCHDCKDSPHPFIANPDPRLAQLCLRCEEMEDEHDDQAEETQR